MFKRLFLGLIVLLAMSAGLYQMRIQILTAAFNTTLAQADIQLLQLNGLKLGWEGVNIDLLVLGLGSEGAPQTLEGVHIGYSVVDAKAHSLLIKNAHLNMPAGGGNNKPLFITDILDQVLAGPLQSISISALEVDGLSVPALKPPFSLQANWEENTFLLVARDQDKKLHIELKSPVENERLLTVNLLNSGEPVAELEASIIRQGTGYQLEGGGRLWADSTMPGLATLIEFPRPVTAASGELLFQLSGQLDDDIKDLGRQSWRLKLLPQTALELAIDNTDVQANLQLSLQQPMLVTYLPGALQDPELSLVGREVAWQLYEQGNDVTVAGRVLDINCQYRTTLSCYSVFDLALNSLQLAPVDEAPLTVENLRLQLSVKVDLDDDHLSASLAPGEWLRAKSLLRGDVLVSGPALVSDTVGELEYRLSTGELDLQIDELQLMLPRMQLPDMNVASLFSLQALELSLDEGGRLEGRARLTTEGINIQRTDTWFPALALESDLALSGQTVSFQGRVLGAGQKTLFDVSAEHQMDAGHGAARILAEKISFDAGDKRLSQHFDYWPFGWDIFHGQLNLELGLKWQLSDGETEIQGSIRQRAQDLAGVYKDIGFVGLNSSFEANFQSPSQLHTTSTATISLDSLDVGVPIDGIKARFLVDLAKQELIVESAEAKVFGGRVWAEEVLYSADKPHNPVYIGVSDLQLDQLLELTDYDAIQGTGTISGLLPLDVNKAGITMQRGMLAAKAPGGVFRYQTEVVAGTNPAMVQVIEALRNYQYSIFQLEADYLENGDLVLAMVLRGSNPDLQQGRPIHLNLNVTDNIPTLLKSLQSGRVIADTVSKQLGGSAR